MQVQNINMNTNLSPWWPATLTHYMWLSLEQTGQRQLANKIPPTTHPHYLINLILGISPYLYIIQAFQLVIMKTFVWIFTKIPTGGLCFCSAHYEMAYVKKLLCWLISKTRTKCFWIKFISLWKHISVMCRYTQARLLRPSIFSF